MDITIRAVTIEDYNTIFELWNSTEQSRRALNPVDDSREGIERYLKRNPATCFLACESNHAHKAVGVILTGHDGRRAIIHHMCVHPDYRRQGIAASLLSRAEEAYRRKGIGTAMMHGAIIRCKQLGIEKCYVDAFGRRKDFYISTGFFTENSTSFWYITLN